MQELSNEFLAENSKVSDLILLTYSNENATWNDLIVVEKLCQCQEAGDLQRHSTAPKALT